MVRFWNGAYLAVIVAALVLPSALTLLWYQITRDPTLRPLGITEQALTEYFGDNGRGIVAILEWGEKRADGIEPDHVARAIGRGFAAKGMEVRYIILLDAHSRHSRVTYRIGATVIGPFSLKHAVDGIDAATDAYRMVVAATGELR